LAKKDLQIAILGAGISGLTVGVRLMERSWSNVTIYSEYIAADGLERRPLVSEVACALWLPIWTRQKEVDDSYRAREVYWSRYSFNKFKELDCSCGIELVHHREFYTEAEVEGGLAIPSELSNMLPGFVGQPVASPPPMPNDMPALTYEQSFETYVVAMPVYLSWLVHRFRELGGKFGSGIIFRSLDDVRRIDAKLYVNALGLAGGHIFGDATMVGVKGQVVLCPPDPNICCSVGVGEYCLIPRRDALVLGSLLQRTFTDSNPTQENIDLILRVVRPWIASGLFHRRNSTSAGKGLKTPSARASSAGLRPFRPSGIRVELEQFDRFCVVHNYGHGGAGVSLSWGCAETVVDLLNEFDK